MSLEEPDHAEQAQAMAEKGRTFVRDNDPRDKLMERMANVVLKIAAERETRS